MASIRKVNFRNPAFAAALRRAEKGNKAVAGANTRGLVSGFAVGEMEKLNRGERAGRLFKEAQKDLAHRKEMNKGSLALARKRLSAKEKEIKGASLGGLVGGLVGGVQTGLNYLDSLKQREFDKRQAALLDMRLEDRIREAHDANDQRSLSRLRLMFPERKQMIYDLRPRRGR